MPGFYENDLVAVQDVPSVLHNGNVTVHRELADAIEPGDPGRLRTAIRMHDTNRLELGMFKPAPGEEQP